MELYYQVIAPCVGLCPITSLKRLLILALLHTTIQYHNFCVGNYCFNLMLIATVIATVFPMHLINAAPLCSLDFTLIYSLHNNLLPALL